MVFAKKVTSNGGFSVFFLDICHANDKLPTFKINFKDEKKLNDFRCTRSLSSWPTDKKRNLPSTV